MEIVIIPLWATHFKLVLVIYAGWFGFEWCEMVRAALPSISLRSWSPNGSLSPSLVRATRSAKPYTRNRTPYKFIKVLRDSKVTGV